MKKSIVYYFIITVIVFSLISCANNNKKAENLEDLKKKYVNLDFKGCDDYMGALNETIDLYFLEIDKILTMTNEAEANNVEIEDYALELETFLFELFNLSTEFESECPEKMTEFKNDFEKRLLEKFESLGIINDYNYDELEYYDDEYIFENEDSIIIENEDEEVIIE